MITEEEYRAEYGDGPVVVTLADGTRLGEVDPFGTPVEFREAGDVRWWRALVVRVVDDGIPAVVLVDYLERQFPVPPSYVRRQDR